MILANFAGTGGGATGDWYGGGERERECEGGGWAYGLGGGTSRGEWRGAERGE